MVIVSDRTIEELEAVIKGATRGRSADMQQVAEGLIQLAGRYAQLLYEDLGKEGIPRDQIEGSGTGPGLGHFIWAVCLITTAWTSWLFPDKALHRLGPEVSRRYGVLVREAFESALRAGQGYVGKPRIPLA